MSSATMVPNHRRLTWKYIHGLLFNATPEARSQSILDLFNDFTNKVYRQTDRSVRFTNIYYKFQTSIENQLRKDNTQNCVKSLWVINLIMNALVHCDPNNYNINIPIGDYIDMIIKNLRQAMFSIWSDNTDIDIAEALLKVWPEQMNTLYLQFFETSDNHENEDIVLCIFTLVTRGVADNVRNEARQICKMLSLERSKDDCNTSENDKSLFHSIVFKKICDRIHECQ